MKKKSTSTFIMGFGLIIFMIALTQSVKAQTPFTHEELHRLKTVPYPDDAPLKDNMRCVFDNNGDGLEDTSFNMAGACKEAFERALAPRILTFEEMKEVLRNNAGEGGAVISVWEMNTGATE